MLMGTDATSHDEMSMRASFMSGLSMAHGSDEDRVLVAWAPTQPGREVAESELIPAHQHPQSRIAQIDGHYGLGCALRRLETA
jgi:hypothetical protein